MRMYTALHANRAFYFSFFFDCFVMLPTYLLCSENTSGIAAYFFMNIFIILPYINIYMENSYTNFGYKGMQYGK